MDVVGNYGRVSGGGTGGIGPQCGEMPGSVLRLQNHDWGIVLRVDPERAQGSHLPIPAVRSHYKRLKVANNYVTNRNTNVEHIRGGGGPGVHGDEGVIP